MDRPFITKMCSSYYNDFELHKEHIWPDKNSAVKELNNYIIQEIDNVKFSNIQLYENLFNFKRDQQYRIIYNLLDQYLNESYELDNTNPNIINESIGATILGGLGSSIGGIFDIIGSAITSTIAATTSIFGVTVGMFVFLALIFFGIKHINYAKAKMAVALNFAITNLAKFVSKHSLSSRMDNAIVFSNLEVCGGKCGIAKFSDIDRFTTYAMHGHGLSNISTVQSKCLFDCFIETTFKLVEACGKQYIACLKSSGDKLGMEKLNSLNIFLKPPSSLQCKIFYTELTKFDRDFTDAITNICQDRDQFEKLINEYHKTLDASLSFDSPKQFNPSFNKPFNKPFHSMPNPKISYNK
jgi:hypothetical protein